MGYGITINQGAFVGDIASSTTNALLSFSSPAYILIGVLLAFMIMEAIIGFFGGRQQGKAVDNLPSTPLE